MFVLAKPRYEYTSHSYIPPGQSSLYCRQDQISRLYLIWC